MVRPAAIEAPAARPARSSELRRTPIATPPPRSLRDGRSRAPDPEGILAAHIGLGLGLVGLVGGVLLVAFRLPSWPAHIVTTFTAAALPRTATTGTVFLLTHFDQGLVVDRILGIVSIGSTTLVIVWGSVRLPERP